MIEDFLGSFEDIVFKFVNFMLEALMRIVQLLLNPIDNVIASFLPGLSYILSKISSLITFISNLIPWVVSYLGLDQTLLNLIVAYFVFSLTVSITLYTIKFAISWLRAIRI